VSETGISLVTRGL